MDHILVFKLMKAMRGLFVFCVMLSAMAVQASSVVGKLGQAIETATIHTSPTTKSRPYYKVKPYEYLIITSSNKPQWLRVLLENWRYGYIEADKIARLPYDVVFDQPTSRSGGTRNPSISGADPKASMLKYSYRYVGTPYKWGGNDPTRGIDCSAFVKHLYGLIGQDLPRTAAEQAMVGETISRFEDLQPGDRLYFWSSKRKKIGHTGIFLGYFPDGGAYFIHSSSSRGGVDTDDLRNSKWSKILVAARR